LHLETHPREHSDAIARAGIRSGRTLVTQRMIQQDSPAGSAQAVLPSFHELAR
jgi:hypothetical protein